MLISTLLKASILKGAQTESAAKVTSGKKKKSVAGGDLFALLLAQIGGLNSAKSGKQNAVKKTPQMQPLTPFNAKNPGKVSLKLQLETPEPGDFGKAVKSLPSHQLPGHERGTVLMLLKPEQVLPDHEWTTDFSRQAQSSQVSKVTGGESAPVSSTPTVTQVPVNQLLEKLEGRIQTMMRQGVWQAQIQLEPADLGRLEIRLQMDQGQLMVRLSAERHDVQEHLNQWGETIREQLKLTMVNTGQVEVQVDLGWNRSREQNNEHAASRNTAILQSGSDEEDTVRSDSRDFGYNTFEMNG